MTSAVDREAAWLALSGGGLTPADGGPWQVVQAYWTRTPNTRQTGIYLLRTGVVETRLSNQRRIQQHSFRAKCWWPIGATSTSTGLWEAEQRAFDDAVDLLLGRIRGAVFDHTHGGAFLSVAEAPEPGRIAVHFADPEQLGAGSVLRADVTYDADDRDFTA